jgi:hypothetical protein
LLPFWLAMGETFLLAALAWVPFRAETLVAAGRVYAALCGAGGTAAGPDWGFSVWAVLVALLFLAVVLNLSNATDFLYFQF